MRKLANQELDRLSVEEFKKAPKTPLIVVLDNVRSLNNVGSVFRTCDAFRVEKIYLCGITATPPHKDIHKTALGSTESVEWDYVEKTSDLAKQLKSSGIKLIGIEQTENAVPLQDFDPQKGVTYAIIFGHEVNGIDQDVIDICDQCIEIPQFGTKHSLNVAVSAGITIWDLYSKIAL
ncbi:MAG: RNA methyltransferase [Flavobacteriaceae bacterium]|nr:RNA methyltransferase [Bacteroidia bacterium]MBT8288777.1 RNA methyltransferase [Bacteroidia bacterium]NNF75703.1 RNA methyltransferase [Flavobacteriaceae bacterium]NNK73274.1 RNA methyltransferase [Flavobacteriaceae bacterium]